jgi:hypothetical protein
MKFRIVSQCVVCVHSVDLGSWQKRIEESVKRKGVIKHVRTLTTHHARTN